MRYKVGDKVRVSKCSVEILKGQIDVIEEVYPRDNSYKLSRFDIRIAGSNLRPAEFKIWCETKEEKQAVIEELEKEGYVWNDSNKKPTEYINDIISYTCPMGFYLREDRLSYSVCKGGFDNQSLEELTPSEFTGIDFSHKSKKIIIEQTKTGAKATYRDKWSYVEGNFEDASRQALAEVLCPFKVGDIVCFKTNKTHKGEILDISITGKVHFKSKLYNGCYVADEFEPYVEPLYNAKLFCIKGSDRFKAGYVYEVKNGMFNDTSTVFNDLNDINDFCSAQFMEVKGGLDE